MTKPAIHTERLLLTWPTVSQIDQYFEDIVGTDIFDTLVWDGPSSASDLHNYWDCCKRNDPNCFDKSFNVAIIEKGSGRCIGGAGLDPIEGNPAILDLGYVLASGVHSKGYATEAVGALVTEAFRHREAQRIVATVFVGNVASRRVVEKSGFAYEGLARRSVLKRNAWLDKWVFAITRPDWEK